MHFHEVDPVNCNVSAGGNYYGTAESMNTNQWPLTMEIVFARALSPVQRRNAAWPVRVVFTSSRYVAENDIESDPLIACGRDP